MRTKIALNVMLELYAPYEGLEMSKRKISTFKDEDVMRREETYFNIPQFLYLKRVVDQNTTYWPFLFTFFFIV